MKRASLLFCFALSLGCAADDSSNDDVTNEVDPRLSEELPVGESNEPGTGKGDEFAHNGEEDFSEICKEIPELEPLNSPQITVSIDGRTLRLEDLDGEYNKVFPVGLGKIGGDGESLTPSGEETVEGLFYTRTDLQALEDGATSDRRKWAWNYSCRIWSGTKYYNPLTGGEEYRSYFAGLPFIRLEGVAPAVYGIHGPIDNYWREDGGELYQGYVSGGCTRMDPDNLVELYALIRGHRTPVYVQREIEFDEDGLAVDNDRFIGSHCLQDSDCADPGASCVETEASGAGFCTMPCSQQTDCPIRDNDILGSIGVWSYCVDDDQDLFETDGYCVIEGNPKTNNNCRSYPAQFEKKRLSIVGEDLRRNVCAL